MRLSAFFLWVQVVVFVVWDVWVHQAYGYEETLTCVIRQAARDHLWVAALIGGIAVHLLEKP